MSDENTPAAETTDLDLFSADLFGNTKTAPEVTEAPASAEEEEVEAQSDALETDTPVEDADGKPEVEEVEDEVEETEPKLTPTQKRINEVVAKQRAAERALEAEDEV